MSVYEQNIQIVKLLIDRKDTDVNIKSILNFFLIKLKNDLFFHSISKVNIILI